MFDGTRPFNFNKNLLLPTVALCVAAGTALFGCGPSGSGAPSTETPKPTRAAGLILDECCSRKLDVCTFESIENALNHKQNLRFLSLGVAGSLVEQHPLYAQFPKDASVLVFATAQTSPVTLNNGSKALLMDFVFSPKTGESWAVKTDAQAPHAETIVGKYDKTKAKLLFDYWANHKDNPEMFNLMVKAFLQRELGFKDTKGNDDGYLDLLHKAGILSYKFSSDGAKIWFNQPVGTTDFLIVTSPANAYSVSKNGDVVNAKGQKYLPSVTIQKDTQGAEKLVVAILPVK